jgi:hypothetical protein
MTMKSLFCLAILVGMLGFSGVAMAARPLRLGGDEVPGARAYLQQLNRRLERMTRQVESFSQAADQAVAAIVAGSDMAVRGSRALASEMSNRPGAMFGYRGQRGQVGDVILLCAR